MGEALSDEEIEDLYDHYFSNWDGKCTLYSINEFRFFLENGMKYEKKTAKEKRED